MQHVDEVFNKYTSFFSQVSKLMVVVKASNVVTKKSGWSNIQHLALDSVRVESGWEFGLGRQVRASGWMAHVMGTGRALVMDS